MPNQRREGQTFVGFQSDADLVRSLDNARGRSSRSLFVRQAVAEKLRSLGFNVSDDLIFAPDRAGRLADAPDPPVQSEKKPVNYRKALKKDRRERQNRGRTGTGHGD